jgi:hypothetical protein
VVDALQGREPASVVNRSQLLARAEAAAAGMTAR